MSRLVCLTRLSIRTRKQEEKDLKTTAGRDPDVTFKNPSESKGGVFETYIRVRSSVNNLDKISSIFVQTII